MMIQIWIVTIFVSLLVFVCYVDLSLSSTTVWVRCGCMVSVAPFSTISSQGKSYSELR